MACRLCCKRPCSNEAIGFFAYPQLSTPESHPAGRTCHNPSRTSSASVSRATSRRLLVICRSLHAGCAMTSNHCALPALGLPRHPTASSSSGSITWHKSCASSSRSLFSSSLWPSATRCAHICSSFEFSLELLSHCTTTSRDCSAGHDLPCAFSGLRRPPSFSSPAPTPTGLRYRCSRGALLVRRLASDLFIGRRRAPPDSALGLTGQRLLVVDGDNVLLRNALHDLLVVALDRTLGHMRLAHRVRHLHGQPPLRCHVAVTRLLSERSGSCWHGRRGCAEEPATASEHTRAC
mmetsp:Transcript_109956/g.354614  ORF Transcript_109956/g.354614 Transcript_109956/m.354614 type:complete len:292 (-) Transcript_109956:407-1282(-)